MLLVNKKLKRFVVSTPFVENLRVDNSYPLERNIKENVEFCCDILQHHISGRDKIMTCIHAQENIAGAC